MINKMLIKQPITDGSSEYTVRIPNMTNWTQNEVLATESYVDDKCEQKTTLYLHQFSLNVQDYTNKCDIFFIDNNPKQYAYADAITTITTYVRAWVQVYTGSSSSTRQPITPLCYTQGTGSSFDIYTLTYKLISIGTSTSASILKITVNTSDYYQDNVQPYI